MSVIHPTAVVDPGAQLGEGVEIGPHCYISAKVVLGDHCRLLHNVSLFGNTTIGCRNELYPGCVIGAVPQDLKYNGGQTELRIGDDNILREHVTIHPGTEVGGGLTTIGNHNRLLIGVHVAHDVHMGSHCVLTNGVQIAGHCSIEDRCHIGGMTGVQSFATIGRYAYIGGLTRVIVDVPPYMIVQGYDPRVRGVNEKALKSRWHLPDDQVEQLWVAYRTLFGKNGGSRNLADRLTEVEAKGPWGEHVKYLLDSVKRSLFQGVYGRYLESLRRDTPQDRKRFYEESK